MGLVAAFATVAVASLRNSSYVFAVEREVLLSFVGNHEPTEAPTGDPGPVLSLLEARRFDHVVLFISGPGYAERARVVQYEQQRRDSSTKFSFVDIDLQSVIDYEEIYHSISGAIAGLEETLGLTRARLFVLLDPGTPQMQTIWFLLAHAGAIDVTLLQGIPRRFGGGEYRYREVRLNPERVPVRVSLSEAVGLAEASGPAQTGEGASAGGRASSAERRRGRAPDNAADERKAGANKRAGVRPASTTAASVRSDSTAAAASVREWIVRPTPVIGESAAFRAVLATIDRVARFDETVLISGETGSGKDVLARRLHELSGRSGSFSAINCASFSAGLVESGLFGHQKGAFTGAAADRLGAFRSAEGGTLFLDEIGELPAETQAKILRAIEQREIVPVGSDRAIKVDVRIVAATNRDLETMVGAGAFRADLYERLRVLPVRIPSLRERDGDAALLVDHFVAEWNTQNNEARQLSGAGRALLAAYHWPRNVRQLRNLVRRILMLSEDYEVEEETVVEALRGEEGQLSHTGQSVTRNIAGGAGRPAADAAGDVARSGSDTTEAGVGTLPVDLDDLLGETERAWFRAALREAGNNRAAAARLLGRTPAAFRKALRERYPDLDP